MQGITGYPSLPGRSGSLAQITMNKKNWIAGSAGLILLMTGSLALAAESHKDEALKHAQAAVEASQKGDAKGVAEHATAAREHVVAAGKENASAHYEAAGKSLDGAVEHGNMGHADIAGKSAEEAVTHLKAAP